MISLYYLIAKPTKQKDTLAEVLAALLGAGWLHLSAPGCSGSRVCCYKIHPWIHHSGIPKVWTASLPALGAALPAVLAASWSSSPLSLQPGCPCPGASLGCPCSQSLCWWHSFLPQNLCSRASFSLPWVLITQDHSGREACAHHLSHTRASLICWSGVSGEAATGWFLRNKKQLHGIFTPSV